MDKQVDDMKFNRHFYKTNSFLFGLALVLAPLVDLVVDHDPLGRLLDFSCQAFWGAFLAGRPGSAPVLDGRVVFAKNF